MFGIAGRSTNDDPGCPGFNKTVYIPLFPSERQSEPASENLRTILKIRNVGDEDRLYENLAEPQLTGIVRSTGDEIDDDVRQILQEYFPKLDYARCVVLEAGGQIPSLKSANHVMWFGVGMLTVWFGMIAWQVYTRQLERAGQVAEQARARELVT